VAGRLGVVAFSSRRRLNSKRGVAGFGEHSWLRSSQECRKAESRLNSEAVVPNRCGCYGDGRETLNERLIREETRCPR
jgi:hypothetical protein